jgi:DNA-binding NarL/FixJ family response regulator
MIRIVTMDRHPTVLAGVEAILRESSGLEHAGSAHDRFGLWPLLQRTHPDVVLLEHTGGDALELCLRLKHRPAAPRVVLHGGGEDDLVPAAFAGADAVLDRTAPVRELVEALRAPALPGIPVRLRARAAERLSPADRAIFSMRLAETPRADVAKVAGIHPSELHGRLASVAARLAGDTVHVPERRLSAVA